MVSKLLLASVASGSLVVGYFMIKRLLRKDHLESCHTAEPESVYIKRYIRLRSKDVDFLVDMKGNTLRRIEREAGCFLRVIYCEPGSVEEVQAVSCPLDGYIVGPEEGDHLDGQVTCLEVVNKAEEQLDYLLSLIRHAIREGQEQRVEEVISVQKQFLGSVIGKRGSNLRRIRLATNTSIKILDKDENGDGAKVTIYGSAIDVGAASEMIEQTIFQFLAYQSRKIATMSERAELATVEQQLKQACAIQRVCETPEASDW